MTQHVNYYSSRRTTTNGLLGGGSGQKGAEHGTARLTLAPPHCPLLCLLGQPPPSRSHPSPA